MSGNSIGHLFKVTTFGESHGIGIGGVVDGCPAGLNIDQKFIQNQVDRRRPGQSILVTQRKESDKVEFLSGIFDGKSTGAPIAFIVHNKDQRPKDYDHLKSSYRPSHGDFTYTAKYGIRDHAGGGRYSARETVSRVIAGAIAQLLLNHENINISGFVSKIGDVQLLNDISTYDLNNTEQSIVRCPDPDLSRKMEELILSVKKEGDTVGGNVGCIVTGMPVGLGQPIFSKLDAELSKAMISIPAAKGIIFGTSTKNDLKGSEVNDEFFLDDGIVRTKTNHSGGIQAGISNGENICFEVLFKPVSTIMQNQKTVDSLGQEVELEGKGRHDPCVVPRAVPIVEAMAAIVIADMFLINKSSKLTI